MLQRSQHRFAAMPEGLRDRGTGSKGRWFPPSFSVSMVTLSCPARICVSGAEMEVQRGGGDNGGRLSKIYRRCKQKGKEREIKE